MKRIVLALVALIGLSACSDYTEDVPVKIGDKRYICRVRYNDDSNDTLSIKGCVETAGTLP